MSLWHRAPREVYRVYGEDEYLADDAGIIRDGELFDDAAPGCGAASASDAVLAGGAAFSRDAAPGKDAAFASDAVLAGNTAFASDPALGRDGAFVNATRSRSGSARLLGVGLLVGVTVGVLGLIELNASHRPARTAAAIARGGQPSIARQGSAVDRVSVAGVSSSLEARDRKPARRMSSATVHRLIPFAHNSSLSLDHRTWDIARSVRLASCCWGGHSSVLGASMTETSLRLGSEPSLDDEFDFER